MQKLHSIDLPGWASFKDCSQTQFILIDKSRTQDETKKITTVKGLS